MVDKAICTVTCVVILLGLPMTIAQAETASGCRAAGSPAEYCVGAAKREITPASPVYLGGYGFGPVRESTGVRNPIYARAIAVSRGAETVVFCAIDTQGHFLAYQEGAGAGSSGRYGCADIRRRVSNDLGVAEHNIIIASTHGHSAPDDAGVWGGVPPSYLAFVADQTVAAIESAIRSERQARLYAGEIDSAPVHLLRSFLPSPYPLDTRLRVLSATDAQGAALATLINFSAHATVLGKTNTLISPDWPGATAGAIEKANPGSTALVMVASVGRTQPNLNGLGAQGHSAVGEYGEAVARLALQAHAYATRVEGQIAVAETVLDEPIDNPVLRSLTMSGTAGVDRVMRSYSSPYLQQDVIRTVVGAVRIGKLFFATVPGESFPETQELLERRVAAQGHYLFSLAEDQLGYDPPPYEVGIVEFLSPLDEGLFIVNSRLGADVTRTLLAEARELGFAVSDARYTGSEVPTNRPFADLVKGTIGSVEEMLVRRLSLIVLWLGYERFR